MELKFFGGASKVTGSAFYLNTGKTKILVDCGTEQGVEATMDNMKEKINAIPAVDLCIITHAHIDHSGLLPLLVKKKKVSKIVSTPATKSLLKLLLYDFCKLQHETENIPLYTEQDIEDSFVLWDEKDDRQSFTFGDIKATFYNNSHILGSVAALIETTGGNFLFSGDIGTQLQQLMDYPPDIPASGVDYLFLESTYGDKTHQSNDRQRLIELSASVCKKGGKVLIPAFAVGRLQEVLYTLSDAKFQFPVYVDTPMGDKVTRLIDEYRLYLKKKLRKLSIGDDLFTNFETVRTLSQSKEIAYAKDPAVIISASGMLEGGRVLNHFEAIKDSRDSMIIFVGYQAAGTLGSRVLSRNTPVGCRIEKVNSFSAHADKNELLQYVERLAYHPYKIFLVHGEDIQRQSLAALFKTKKIRTELAVNMGSGSANLEPVKKNVFLHVAHDNLCEFHGYRLMPFAGYIVETENEITVETKDWYDRIFNEAEVKVKQNITLDPGIITPPVNAQKDIISKQEIEDNIRLLFSHEVLTKNRLTDFWDHYIKGPVAAKKFVQDTHFKNPNTGKRRWNKAINTESEEKAEQLYELANQTLFTAAELDKNNLYNILIKFAKI